MKDVTSSNYFTENFTLQLHGEHFNIAQSRHVESIYL